MSLVLYESRIDFQNVDTEGADAWADRGGRLLPALWGGERLHQGRHAALAALETLRP